MRIVQVKHGQNQKEKQKKEKARDALANAEQTTYQEGGASSSSTPAPKTKPVKQNTSKQKPAHTTNKDTSKSESHWKGKGVGYIIDQLETHYGVRLEKGLKT